VSPQPGAPGLEERSEPVLDATGGAVGLRRSLGLPLLVLYGLGTTIGAGIYVLAGKIAGIAGSAAPLAFLGASLLAAFTAASFAELSSRFPTSAGEVHYVRAGLGSQGLGTLVGLLVVAAGTVSGATMSQGFAGHLAELWGIPRLPALVGLVLVLTGIAAWGIGESLRIAAAVTLVEIFGLCLVLWVTRGHWSSLPEQLPAMVPTDLAGWGSVGTASLLAFYAFLGFEDMVNIAEEVKQARRRMPVAIAITLVVTSLLYTLIAAAAVLTVAPSELAQSEAPLAMVYSRAGGGDPRVLGAIAILAVVNGALVQIIMAARVLYGMGALGALPARLARVHRRTRTPLLATVVVGFCMVALGVTFPLVRLAEATALITLTVFGLVNLALVRLHWRAPTPAGAYHVPRWAPIAGALVSFGVLGSGLIALFT